MIINVCQDFKQKRVDFTLGDVEFINNLCYNDYVQFILQKITAGERRGNMKYLKNRVLAALFALLLLLSACTGIQTAYTDLPEYELSAYTPLNENMPSFLPEEFALESYEEYGNLDYHGRCTYAEAVIGIDIMPTEERGAIGSVKPSGWQTVKYDFVDGKYLYNRCHLIGYQLTGENANERNLITGTRYMNVEGMLPFENLIAEYVEETENHVALRVTPVFEDQNLLASGVIMEAISLEDEGEGICFNVYCHNVQPGVVIDYKTGESYEEKIETGNDAEYVLNTNSKKIHLPTCQGTADISEKNKEKYFGSIEKLIISGGSAGDF